MFNFLALSLIVSMGAPESIHRQAIQYFENGQYEQAATLCTDALSHQDPTSLEAALTLRDLSRAYRGEGLLAKAVAARRQELEIVKARLGEEDANVALALDGIGEIYFEQGRVTAARKSFEDALRIGQKALDPESPHLATMFNDLGAAYCRDGWTAEAAKLFRRALAIRDSEVTRANLEQAEHAVASRR